MWAPRPSTGRHRAPRPAGRADGAVAGEPVASADTQAARSRLIVVMADGSDIAPPAEALVDESTLADWDAFCRGYLWPVYQGLPGRPTFRRGAWLAYWRANEAYAAATAAAARNGDTVWVHGHRLLLVPALMRRRSPGLRIGLTLDVPVPAGGDRGRRRAVGLLEALAAADYVGVESSGCVANLAAATARRGAMPVNVGVHPPAIDTSAVAETANRLAVIAASRRVRHRLATSGRLLLSIDTADAIEEILHRLDAFESLHHSGALRPAEWSILQVVGEPVQPDRPADLDAVLTRRVAEINDRYGSAAHQPVVLLRSELDLASRVALYQAADLLVAGRRPRVALEFVAAARAGAGMVMSSRNPAAALTEPYLVGDDPRALAPTIASAMGASEEERVIRMSAMRERVADYDTAAWAAQFRSSLAAA
jgi:trehalose 6-phosphate synthase/phosphatase